MADLSKRRMFWGGGPADGSACFDGAASPPVPGMTAPQLPKPKSGGATPGGVSRESSEEGKTAEVPVAREPARPTRPAPARGQRPSRPRFPDGSRCARSVRQRRKEEKEKFNFEMKEERDEELRAAGLAPPGEKRAAERTGRPLFPGVRRARGQRRVELRDSEVRGAEVPVNRAATPRTAMRQGQRASDVADRAAAASGLADARRATQRARNWLRVAAPASQFARQAEAKMQAAAEAHEHARGQADFAEDSRASDAEARDGRRDRRGRAAEAAKEADKAAPKPSPAAAAAAPRRADAGIKKAFFKLALKYHPDRNDADTTATMMKINAAYATLGDAQERLKYDALFACGVF
ncbi:hypothetical protein JL722_4319 [Aureococcus anophagefferens]|nr:hypothetical protein JL722_4319 [Aureococcus anophagefferens]